ncbi:MAG: IS3 family transposase [Pseudomonadales bacterium]|nr:IS3 family transposase [Pseudomonadales bacterium]
MLKYFSIRLKSEIVHHESFQTREEAKQAIFEYIRIYYNRQKSILIMDICPQ